MLRAALFTVFLAFLAPVLQAALQVPLGSSFQHWIDEDRQAVHEHEDLAEWDPNKLPDPNTTDHLVFETAHSLLQHWPNTRMRNGHTIVPGIIPNGTLLYHGKPDEALPRGPEWVATDPEHSYLFCRDLFNSSKRGGWHFTYMTTRPLKLIYFDGSSAVKLPYGSMDTQDLLIWGKMGDVIEDEEERIQDLCKWGKNFSVDGFVRMEMDFEIMLCDFDSGLQVVSVVNVFSQWYNGKVNSILDAFEVMHAGSWHYHFPGETRIQLDLAGMVTFYDTHLVPSLVAIRAGRERWDHRVANISSEDLLAARSRLEGNLIIPDARSSGIDWKTLFHVIVDRYAQRLELTRYLVNSSAMHPDEILDVVKKAQTQLRIMLTPYLLFSASPPNQSIKPELEWTIPIYKLCATTHTHLMETRFEHMTESERVLLQATRGTSREICRVVTKMWAAGVHAGLDPLLNTKASPDVNEVVRLRDTWAEELKRLITWLDWSVWIKCDSECGPEEMCYLPTWPIGFPWNGKFPLPSPSDPENLSNVQSLIIAMGELADGVRGTAKLEPDEWIRPRPKCIRRIAPYTF